MLDIGINDEQLHLYAQLFASLDFPHQFFRLLQIVSGLCRNRGINPHPVQQQTHL